MNYTNIIINEQIKIEAIKKQIQQALVQGVEEKTNYIYELAITRDIRAARKQKISQSKSDAYMQKADKKIDKKRQSINKQISKLKFNAKKEITKIDDNFNIYKSNMESISKKNKSSDNKWLNSKTEKIDKQIKLYENKKTLLLESSLSEVKKTKNILKIDKKIQDIKSKNNQAISSYKNKNILIENVKNHKNKLFSHQNKNKQMSNIKNFISKNKIIIIVLAFSIIAGLYNQRFFTWENFISTIAETNAYWGILAIGMTFVIITGGIDLSVGSSLALTGFVGISLIYWGYSLWIAFLVAIVFGLILGLFLGIFIGIGKLPAFIITLVGMLIFRGIVRLMAHGNPVSVDNDTLFYIATGRLMGIPIMVVILIVITFIAWFVLKYTKFGRHLYATGSNKDAAKMSGVKVKWIITSAYVISGISVAIAAILFMSSIQSVGPNAGIGFELDAIAAVVLGGTSLVGGKGGVLKTIVGWIVISILGNALIFMGFTSDWQIIFKGLVILITVVFDKGLGIIPKAKKLYRKAFALR